MTDREYKAIIESILFFWGDPMPISTISEVVGISKIDVEKLLDEMVLEFENNQRGTTIKKIGKSYQMVTVPIGDSYIQKLLIDTDEKNLSNSALETLSIIAYKQPVTRIEIDSIRGVKSTGCINTLLARELIEEVGKLDRIGRPILYGTTDEFLRVFNLPDIGSLPEVTEIEHRIGVENGKNKIE